jgi:hypothetical protein
MVPVNWRNRSPYREKEINNIHDTKNKVGDLGLVVSVAGKDQYRGNDMVD